MKIKQATLYTGLLIGAIGALSFINENATQKIGKWHGIQKFGSGAPTGRSGAPGDQNCTVCHSGSTAPNSGDGIQFLTLTDGANLITSYLPNTTYTGVLLLNTATTKNGFQLVALNSNNNQAGTIATLDTKTNVVTSGGKQYLNQTTAGNQQKSWSFSWTSPSTNVGEVTFYVATNSTNGNGQSSGDVIRLSQHVFGSIAGVKSPEKLTISAGYNSSKHAVDVSLGTLNSGEAFINIVDLNGRSVFTENLGNVSSGESDRTVLLPSDLKAGMYVVNLSVDNNYASKKIVVAQ